MAVDGFLSPSAALADVVLPVATTHERTGTTTNIEGRVHARGAEAGGARPVLAGLDDRRRARRHASARDLGVSSAAELWDEIERLAPSHAGITRAVLDTPRRERRDRRPSARLAGARSRAEAAWRRSTPWPHPGSTPSRPRVPRPVPGSPSRPAVTSSPPGATARRAGTAAHRVGTAARPAPATRRVGPGRCAGPSPSTCRSSPPPDGHSLRLMSARRLYDQGVLLAACRSLAPLGTGGGRAGQSARPGTAGRHDRRSGSGSAPRAPRRSSRSVADDKRPPWRARASTSTSTGDDAERVVGRRRRR